MKAEKRNMKLGNVIKAEVKKNGRASVMAKLNISASTLERWMKLGVPESKKGIVVFN